MDILVNNDAFVKFAICRACMGQISLPDACKPLFSDRIAEMFTTCTNIEIQVCDGLPAHVCLRCFQTLYMVYAFKEQCIASDLKLKQLIKPNHPSLVKDESLALSAVNIIDAVTKLEDDFMSEAQSTIPPAQTSTTMDDQKNTDPEEDELDKYMEPKPKPKKKKVKRNDPSSSDKPKGRKKRKSEGIMCGVCYKEVTNIERLMAHLRVHQGEKPEICKKCGLSFSNMGNLKRHLLKHNPGEAKKYKCEVCSKLFAYSTTLTIHMKIHDNIRQFICDLCGKSFVQRSSLTSHALVHTSETPFSCDVCGKKFKMKMALKAHEIRHTSDKKFTCQTCGKMFFTGSELATHIRSHTHEKPFPCSVCNKGFTTKSHLTGHMRSHTGSRPYACDICPKSFALSETLKHHRMTHTGEKPHACVVCHRQFIQRSALITHMKTHKVPQQQQQQQQQQQCDNTTSSDNSQWRGQVFGMSGPHKKY